MSPPSAKAKDTDRTVLAKKISAEYEVIQTVIYYSSQGDTRSQRIATRNHSTI